MSESDLLVNDKRYHRILFWSNTLRNDKHDDQSQNNREKNDGGLTMTRDNYGERYISLIHRPMEQLGDELKCNFLGQSVLFMLKFEIE